MKLIDKKTLRVLIPIHPEHAMRLARQGKFPRPIKFGDSPGSRVAWREADIEMWIAQRAAARG